MSTLGKPALNGAEEIDPAPRAPHANNGGPTLDLANRITLGTGEAAWALGVSETTLRQMLPDIPHFHSDKSGRGRVLIPVEGLKRWAEARAVAQGNRVGRVAAEIERAFASNKS